MPAIGKAYLDNVLQPNEQHTERLNFLVGKRLSVAITTGGKQLRYKKQKDLEVLFQMIAKFLEMSWGGSFILYSDCLECEVNNYLKLFSKA